MTGPAKPNSPISYQRVIELISARYERRSLLITANQPFGDWGKVFPDPAMTVAVVDRLVHHATIFEMNVESYRRRAALERKRGVAGRPPRIASPEMFPEAEMLPHLICSRPIFIGGANDEADQYGSARRVGGCGGRPVCEGRSGRTGADSRRVCGGNRLSPQACDAAVAGWAGESAKWPAARPADLRSGCARGVDPGLGGIRPDLWQTAAAAATDPGRGPGAARPCSAGTGGAHQITGDERGDDRPGIGRCPAAGGNGNPPPVGSFRGDQAQRAGAHL